MSFGLLLDLDGVVLPSPAVNCRLFQAVLREFGLELTEELFYTTGGHPLGRTLKMWCKIWGCHLDYEPFYARVQARLPEFDHEYTANGPDPDFIRLIEDVRAVGGKAAIVTSNGRDRVARWFARLGYDRFFSPVQLVCHDDVTRHKPHPEPIYVGASRTGFEPSWCVMVGDQQADVQAARAAGSRAVGFVKHLRPQDRHVVSGADLTVSCFSRLTVPRLLSLLEG